MNYRLLLLKYIAFVGDVEGTDFISESNRSMGVFTDEEWMELELLASESGGY
jgi:hypothetical protein